MFTIFRKRIRVFVARRQPSGRPEGISRPPAGLSTRLFAHEDLYKAASIRAINSSSNIMQSLCGLLALVGVCSAQLFAWPSSSYNPYYARYFAAASAPVAVGPAMAAPAVAAAPVAAAYASALSPPVAAGPAIAAATANGAALLMAPAFAAPVYAAPAVAAPAPAYAPVAARPVMAAPVAAAPAVVPAYAPFQTAAYMIGSNKAAKV